MNNQPVVLYVEDDPQSRKLMQMLLMGRMQLKDLIVFEDSSDFLTRVNALDPKPDIIFLDIHVKPYSGFDMLQMLRQLDWVNGTPIVALTASVMSEEVEQLQNAGFNGCLAKPINLDTFPDTFMRILDGEWVWRIIH
jgi:two-component system, sensor histidine kinase